MNVKDRIRGLFQQAELLVFFFFLVTSLFLGDGKQSFVDVWWALGILTMYGVRYYQRGKLDLRPLPRFIGWAWAAILLYYVILTPFSDSVGYSITAIVRLIEAYLLYVLFYAITSERTIALFVKGLLFVGVVATLASFVFLLVPSWTSFLPPMNLLYATYGHNHLADLLLFTIPIAVGMVERKRNTMTVGVLVLFLVGMALTLARGAWIILIVYLLFVFLKKKDVRVKVIALVGAAVLAGAIFLLTVVSVNKTAAGMFQKVPQVSRLLQKQSFLEDGRWEYWRQAIEAIKERPLFGSGPGTFCLQSKRLQARPNSYSWFAHSAPLQVAVETGVVGLAIFLFLFWNVFRKSERSPLLWGAALVLVYGFYEFSLNYITIWLLVWAALGTLLKPDNQNKKKPKTVVGALIVLALFYASSIGSTMASVAGNQTLAFFLAPHDANKAKELLEKQNKERNDALAAQIPVTMFFHGVNSDVYALFVDQALDEPEKQRRKETVVSLDPWKRNEYALVEYYIQRREWDRVQQELNKTLDMWAEAKRVRGYEADYAKRQELSRQMLETGDGLFIEKKPTEAAAWYVQAQKIDAWALDKHSPPSQDNLAFFNGLAEIPGKFFGRYKEEYAKAWQGALVESLRVDNAIDATRHAEGIMHIAPWAYNRLWKDVAPILIQKAEDKEKIGQPEQAAEVLLQAFALWESLTKNGQQVDWELQQKTANLLVRVGNKVALHNLIITKKTYDAALSMVPWVGDKAIPWYAQYTPEEIETSVLIAYIGSDINSGPWGQQSKAYAALFLVDKMINEDKPQEAFRYANFIDTPSIIGYSDRKRMIVKLQKKTDELLEDNKQRDAEALVTNMVKLLPEDYWVAAQKGNFYVVVGDIERAKLAFGECLVMRLGNHDECSSGLQKINKGDLGSARYQQMSLIIQGKARWQDF